MKHKSPCRGAYNATKLIAGGKHTPAVPLDSPAKRIIIVINIGMETDTNVMQ
ncbi:MAG: hypothetical protein CM1200mP22_04840 [Dehalococcoidia bacterium]|nr:MAG: hypothetical protein CM1200mP22_04840 [Dehalococcoidia bacterium]